MTEERIIDESADRCAGCNRWLGSEIEQLVVCPGCGMNVRAVSVPLEAKLWHDDIRRPPDDSWLWARTNAAALMILTVFNVVECSLDHDLGLHDEDPDVPDADLQRGWDTQNDGFVLVGWMIDNKKVPSKVTIHSWNPVGAERMENLIRYAMDHEMIEPVEVKRQRYLRADERVS